MARHFAGRDDVVVSCAWDSRDAGKPAGWHDDARARLTCNAHRVVGEGMAVDVIDPLTPQGRRSHPVVVGVVVHQAAHAAHDPGPAPQGIDAVVDAAYRVLGEGYVEVQHTRRRSGDRAYLKAASTFVDTDQFTLGRYSAQAQQWVAGATATLCWSRLEVGIWEPYDVAGVLDRAHLELGADRFELLRAVVADAWNAADASELAAHAQQWVAAVGGEGLAGQVDGLHAVTTALWSCAAFAEDAVASDSEWANLAHEELVGVGHESDEDPGDSEDHGDDGPDEDPVGDSEAPSDGGDGDGGPGSDEGEGEGAAESPATVADDVLTELGHQLAQLAAAVEDEAQGDADDAQAALQHAAQARERARRRKADAKVQKQRQKRANLVFSEDALDRSRHETRAPTTTERGLASRIRATLRRAQFRDRTPVRHHERMPPGRLDGRAAMLGRAQRAMGTPVTAEPFIVTQYRVEPQPPLTVGVMIDTSSSMSWAETALPSVAWAFSHAMGGIDGQSAVVTFGAKATPLIRPGERPAQVRMFSATAAMEDFSGAFDALDGALDLVRGQGVRILIVVSDGYFQPAQRKATHEAITDLNRAGATVLWLGPEEYTDFPRGVEVAPIPLGDPHPGGHGTLRWDGQVESDDVAGVITDVLAERLATFR